MIGALGEAVELLGMIGSDAAEAEAASGGTSWLDLDIPIPLDSSWLKVKYNIGQGVAIVEFPNGDEHEYPCSIIKMINWFRADSPGRFFNSEIKQK